MHCIDSTEARKPRKKRFFKIYGAPSRKSPERLQKHKDTFILSHTHTHTHTHTDTEIETQTDRQRHGERQRERESTFPAALLTWQWAVVQLQGLHTHTHTHMHARTHTLTPVRYDDSIKMFYIHKKLLRLNFKGEGEGAITETVDVKMFAYLLTYWPVQQAGCILYARVLFQV